MNAFIACLQPAFTAPIAVLISLWILKPLAARLNLLDHPGGRKIHAVPTPVIGGIALFIGLTIAFLSDAQLMEKNQVFWFFSAFIVCIGVIDDRQGLSARSRLMVHALTAFGLIVLGNVRVLNLGDHCLSSMIQHHSISLIITLVVMIAFINAINMLDGLDGLVGGIALGECFLLWLLSSRLESVLHQILSIFLCMILVFLMFNFSFSKSKQAKIFLGDAGSTFLAFFLISTAISLSQHHQESNIKPITILWCMLFPFLDLLSVCIIRYRLRKPCFQAGHEHIHHILLRAGLPRAVVSLFLAMFSLSIGLVGLSLAWLQVSENAQLVLIFGFILFYLTITFRVYKHGLYLVSDITSTA